jgi:phenylpropionate dioxygenase-like ring-hydroxylating dioxygenase large terminal subunit
MSSSSLPAVSLHRWKVQVNDGWVWVAAPASNVTPSPYRAAFADDAGYRGFNLVAEIEANLADAIENLLDGTHTPFVHAGLVRSANSKQSFTAWVRRHENCIEAEYRGEARQNGFISKFFEPQREVSFGRFVPPCTAELEYRSKRRLELLVIAHFTPTVDAKLNVFLRCYIPNGRLPAWFRFAVIRPFFVKVLLQDRKILKLQQWNIERFGKPAYTNWHADLLRPWIDAWFEAGVFPAQPLGPSKTRFEL